MERDLVKKGFVCPRCGQTCTARPAAARDGSGPCGTREALESLGVAADEQEKILDTIHRHQM